jgi:hypothetical protein
MINPFCYIGAHNWEYRKEKHECKNHPKGLPTIRVVVRECKWCGHREHHMLPRINGKFTTWKTFDDISEGDCIEFKRLTDEFQNEKID